MGHLGAVGAASEVYGFSVPPSTPLALLLLAGAALADEPAVTLAEPGEAVADAVVERVELHPEFQRYWLRFPGGGVIPAEVTYTRPGHEGLCEAGGVTLFPREELGERAEGVDSRAAMDALCARLPERTPAVGPVQTDTPTPAAPAAHEAMEPIDIPPYPVALMGVVAATALVAGVVLAGEARRGIGALAPAERRELGLVALVGLLARLLASPRGIFNAEAAAYEKIVLAWGISTTNPYGEGFNALHALPLWLLGRTPDRLFALNLGWSALLPPIAWYLARVAAGSRADPRVAGLGAGLAAALLPVAVRVAATELMHVSVATLVAVAVAAAVAQWGRSAPALALLAAGASGLAAHTRPEAGPAMGLVAVLLAGGRGAGRALGLVALGGLGAAWVAGLPPTQGVLPFDRLLTARTWTHLFRPRLDVAHLEEGAILFLTGLTPAFLWAWAGAGLLGLRARSAAVLVLGWGALELPVVLKSWPMADAIRLQLPSQLGWVVLVGLGAGVLARGLPRAPAWAAWALGGALAVRLGVLGPGPVWPHQQEYRLLAEVVPTLPEGAVVVHPDGVSRAPKFARVMRTLGPARWVGASAFLAGGDVRPTLVYRSVDCARDVSRELCAAVEARCRLAPWRTTRVGAPTDLDVSLPPEGVEVGFWTVEGCGGPR